MTRLLLIGCGAFGRVHLAALARLGRTALVLEPDPAARAAAPPGTRFAAGLAEGLAGCDAAILATPPATHVPLAEAVLRAGRDLFLEKPATETAAQSAALHALAAGRIVQLGLFFRFHPKAQAIHRLARAGGFGPLHHLSARMSGLKRARGDSGALLNDAVHFADLLPWIAGEAPTHVFAMLADPLRRGREDLAVIQLRFASGATALIEAGCVLPGEHADAVVPGAETRKLLAVAGRDALAEVDFMAETLRLRRGRHRPAASGAWLPDHAPAEDLGAPALDPVGVVAAQLAAFLHAVDTRIPQGPDLFEGGVLPLRILDAARRSAHERRVEELFP
ncbi:Gfo/Idh/MocA family oxidoreductase [Falsiroseomonas selenitidurans]|uniref:Gfo/Idh/MocA family oxidoreductase n=1 Tax=Falsiroseomonas selenitidurans TaxID=2716335 RepID=A0ABX1E6A6_9PROT|nr:Gfo/Idh/MocA family oxidoreductase [Falsiroseomonas selenitidurans]NKC32729.1 Gfo/Idh/MocA family oxidoreductase [Falsiroseomonas selenitidurans]